MGVDGIPTKFVKASPVSMAVLVSNKSILSAVFLDCWKVAIVTPVSKPRTGSSLAVQLSYNLSATGFL